MSSTIERAQKEWNDAAKKLAEIRAKLREVEHEHITAMAVHRKAKNEYIRLVDERNGIEGEKE